MPSIYALFKCAVVFAAAQSGSRICDARGLTHDNNLMPEPAGGFRFNDLDLAPSPPPVRTQLKNFPPPVSNRRPPPALPGPKPIGNAASVPVLAESTDPSLQIDRDALVNPPYPKRKPRPFLQKNSRTYIDQADDVPDAQIHVVYAVPDGAIDRRLDTERPGLVDSASSIQYWMAGQTEGRWLRYDTADNQLDVTYVALPLNDTGYDMKSTYKIDGILEDVNYAISFQEHKIYSVYYEGSGSVISACGNAYSTPPDQTRVLTEMGNVVYLQTPRCFPGTFASGQDEIGIHEFTALHEIIHNLGAVDPRAPNTTMATSGHVDTSYTDIMYVSLDPNAPLAARRRVPASSVLDFNRQNYYNPAGLPNGLVNIADSRFMISPTICNNRTEDCNPVFPPPPASRPPLSYPPLSYPPQIYASAPGPDHPPPSHKSAAFRMSPDPRLLATIVASGAAIIVAAV